MRIIGLTGPSGSGKSSVCKVFAEYGFLILDADSIYHSLLFPHSPCLDEIVSFFSESILRDDFTLDRQALGKIVFASPEKLGILNSISHKYVLNEFRRICRENESVYTAAIADAPLLFESGFDRECEFTLSVLASRDTRLSRIISRDNISREAALMRINAQKPDDFYISRSDEILYNDGTTEQLYPKIKTIIEKRRFDVIE